MRLTEAETARFWAKVDRSAGPDECWPWTAARSSTGYGVLKLRGKVVGAHRVAHAEAVGPPPEGMCVCHRCDNPPCCNPAHFFLGTDGDNAADRVAKGRQQRGERAGGAILTEGQVREIRELIVDGVLLREIADRFSVTVSAVSDIGVGRRWGWLS